MERMRPVPAAVVLLLLLGACGSGGGAQLTEGTGTGGGTPAVTVTTAVLRGPPAAPPSRPVCELIARDEVARILGNAVRAGTGAERFCFFGTSVDKGTSADIAVSIPAAGAGERECAIQQNSLPKEATLESVGGIGSSGTWAYQRNALLLQGTLVACWPESVVRVLVSGEKDQSVLRGHAVALAEAVRGRL
jgi:hypothetical protein